MRQLPFLPAACALLLFGPLGYAQDNVVTITPAKPVSIPAPSITPLAPEPYPALLSCGGANVTGGQILACEVWFTEAVSRDTAVDIKIARGDHRGAPRTATLHAGQRRLMFEVSTTPVAASTTLDITVASEGQTLSATRTVLPPALQDISLSIAEVPGGAISRGRVTLSGPAPMGGVPVYLSSSNEAAATVPSPIWVPAYSNSISFTVKTKPVKTKERVTISASVNNSGASTPLLVAQQAKPDLLIYRWEFYDAHGTTIGAPPAKQPFITCVDIVNKSYGSAPASKLRVILLDNSGGSNLEWEKNVVALGPGEDAKACVPMPRLDPHHTYVINMYVDSNNDVDESDKSNNFQAYERIFSDSDMAENNTVQPRLPAPPPAATIGPAI